MDRVKSFSSSEIQKYANRNSLRLNQYQQELIDYTMRLSWSIIYRHSEAIFLFKS